MLRKMQGGMNIGAGASGCHCIMGRQIIGKVMYEMLPFLISRMLKDLSCNDSS